MNLNNNFSYAYKQFFWDFHVNLYLHVTVLGIGVKDFVTIVLNAFVHNIIYFKILTIKT